MDKLVEGCPNQGLVLLCCVSKQLFSRDWYRMLNGKKRGRKTGHRRRQEQRRRSFQVSDVNERLVVVYTGREAEFCDTTATESVMF